MTPHSKQMITREMKTAATNRRSISEFVRCRQANPVIVPSPEPNLSV